MFERFFPPAASQHAHQIDQIIDLVHVLMFLLFIGWSIYFLVVLFRFRAGRNPKADPVGVKSKASTWVEVGVALAEVVLLIGFSVPLWGARVSGPPSDADAVVVRVVAQQFAWNIWYAGADGEFGQQDLSLLDEETNPLGLDRSGAGADDITTINQLHLPVNRPALIHLSSKDVIHSFNLPNMRVKQDAVPGLSIPTWFVPTKTTAEMRQQTGNPEYQYELACAQLCGNSHYSMRGFLTVETQEEFDAWLAEEASYLGGEGEDFWN